MDPRPDEEEFPCTSQNYFEEADAVVHCLNTMTNADGLQLIFDGDLRAYEL